MVTLLGLTLGWTRSTPAASPAEERQAVEEANRRFYKALDAVFDGDVSQMDQVWSHTDDVTYMGPVGGMEIGWDQVSGIWRQEAALKLSGHIEPRNARVVVGSELAFVECYELGGGLETDRDMVEVSIRSTSVFRKEDAQWKMIAHHTDLVRALEQAVVDSAEEEDEEN